MRKLAFVLALVLVAVTVGQAWAGGDPQAAGGPTAAGGANPAQAPAAAPAGDQPSRCCWHFPCIRISWDCRCCGFPLRISIR